MQIESVLSLESVFEYVKQLEEYVKQLEERVNTLEKNGDINAKKGRPKKVSKEVVCKGSEEGKVLENDPFKNMLESQADAPVDVPVPVEAKPVKAKAKRVYKKKEPKLNEQEEKEPELSENVEQVEPKLNEQTEKVEKVEKKGKGGKSKKSKAEVEESKAEVEEAVKCIRINEEGKKVTKAYKGKSYLKGNDNFLYDEEHNQIGKWNETENKLELYPVEQEIPPLEDEEQPENYE